MNLIFDIGGNRGKMTNVFSEKSVKVIVFEPNPKLVTLLNNNFQTPDVIIDNRAISDTKGFKTFNISNADTISTFSYQWIENSRFTGKYKWDKTIEVETLTLSDAINEYDIPDYIKIDTEGHEYDILINFHQLLPNTIFSFEWAEEQKDKIKKILNHMYSLGYTKYSYTYGDKILFDEEISWVEYQNLKLLDNLDENRMEKWGMLYFKK